MTSSEQVRICQAARRLRAIAKTAPGYAPALVNLAGDLQSVAQGHIPDAVGDDSDPQAWALAVADAVILGEVRSSPACAR